MKLSFITLLVAAFSITSAGLSSNTTLLAQPVAPPSGLGPTRDFVASAMTASAAARGAQRFAGWLNGIALEKVISESVTKYDAVVAKTLKSTGQNGVLFEVAIERTDGEIPFYTLENNSISYIGAGTSIDATWFAFIQQPTYRPSIRAGAKYDFDRSYFLWFENLGGTAIRATMRGATFVVYPAAAKRSTEILREQINKQSLELALQVAVDFVQQTTKEKNLQQKIQALKAQQAESNRRTAELELNLKNGLERIRKHQAISDQWGMLSAVLSFSGQVANTKTFMGDDAPKDVDKAASSSELKTMIDNSLKDSLKRQDEFQMQYRSYEDKRTGIRSEYYEILRSSKYPLKEIPQIQKL